MAFQTVFKRYELKYLLTPAEKEQILEAMSTHMALDSYGQTTIRNIYLDTDNYRLIRRSMEKPTYKEKLRIRSYCQATDDSTVFVELKKKYEQVVYKRRLPLSQRDAIAWVCQRTPCPLDTQISREIDYFMDFYGKLTPAMFLSYLREAYYDISGTDFRVTFDNQIFARNTDMHFSSPVYGTSLLPKGKILMELKCAGGIPLWMVEVLSRHHIYKTTFSKYAAAYTALIFPQFQKEKELVTDEHNI